MVVKNVAFFRSTYRRGNLNNLSLKMCLVHEWNDSDMLHHLFFKLGCNEIAAASAVSSGKLLHTGQSGSGRKECRVHCSVCKFSKMSSFF